MNLPETSPTQERESEPRAGSAAVPLWLVLTAVALLCWSAIFVVQNAGGFDERVYWPHTSARELAKAQPPIIENPVERGRQIYVFNCSACHQTSGLGDSAKGIPPLAGSEWVQAAGAARVIRIALDGVSGPITVKGEEWNLSMPAWKEILKSDQQIADVLSYIRTDWGNKAPTITPEQVAAVRAKEIDRSEPWTAPSLIAIPEN